SNRTDERHVLIFNSTTERVREKLLDGNFRELIRIPNQPVAHSGRSVNLSAVEHRRRRIDSVPFVLRPPSRYRLKGLHCKPDWIHHAVALNAVGANAMIEHLLAHRRYFRIPGGIRHSWRKRWNVRWWIRRLHTKNVRHDPLAASNRRCSVGLSGRNEK